MAGGSDRAAWRGIMVVAQVAEEGFHSATLELLGKARELADRLETEVFAAVIGAGLGNAPAELVGYGADKVYVVEGEEFSSFVGSVFGTALARLVEEVQPEMVIAAATDQNRSFLPYAATLLETGLTANCMELDVDEEERLLLPTRPAYSGNLMATIVCPERRPQMATVKPYSFPLPSHDSSRRGEVVPFDPGPIGAGGVRVVESRPLQREGPDLRKADFIVGIGRGVADEKLIAQAQELASLTGGAVGATRPVCDMGLLPESAQIGQTGVSISPKMYLALGISGAAPHTVGIQNVDAFVAVNKDESAPVFDMASHCVVGDARVLLPLLVHEVQKIVSK